MLRWILSYSYEFFHLYFTFCVTCDYPSVAHLPHIRMNLTYSSIRRCYLLYKFMSQCYKNTFHRFFFWSCLNVFRISLGSSHRFFFFQSIRKLIHKWYTKWFRTWSFTIILINLQIFVFPFGMACALKINFIELYGILAIWYTMVINTSHTEKKMV